MNDEETDAGGIDEVTNRWLEEESFRNLIYFYRRELTRVQRGGRVVDAFPESNQRKRLYHHGVLYRAAKKGEPGLHGRLSPETLLILDGLCDE